MLPNSVIPQSDDRLLSYFVAEIFKNLTGIGKRKDELRSDDTLLFALLGLITIVGTEPFKVLLRRNIGRLSLSLFRLTAAVFIYIILGGLLFVFTYERSLKEYHSAFYAGAVFYWLLSLTLLGLGVVEYIQGSNKYKENPDDISTHLYRGDSLFFKASSDNTNPTKIWLVKEPLSCFLFTLSLTLLPMFIHPILGLISAPLFLSSLSFWFNEWFQVNNVWNVRTKTVAKELAKTKVNNVNHLDEPYHIVNN